jgi:lipopolysaccharide cholinephosphotransferase
MTLIRRDRKHQKKNQTRYLLDIFPIDGLGKHEDEAKKRLRKIQKKYLLYLSREAGFRDGRSFYKNMFIWGARCIPNFIIDEKKQRISIDNLSKELSLNESVYCANTMGNWGIKELITVKTLGEPTEYIFESINIFGVQDYDTYLKGIYGEWRTLPPIEKQASHHDFLYIDLDHGYMY